MKKLDWKSFLFGAALGVAPIATVAVVSLTSSEATAQLWGRFRSQAVVAAPGQVVVCSETCVDDGAKSENAEFVASSTQWTRGFDDSWVAEELERHPIKKIDDNKTVWNIKGSQKEGHTYGNYTEADALLWKKETERLVAEGSLIFHSADLLGSKNGVSCDIEGNDTITANIRKKKFGFYYKFPLFIRCWLLFIYNYIFRLGFLDGKEGFIYNYMYHRWYRTLVDTKIYEQMKFPKEFEKTGALK